VRGIPEISISCGAPIPSE